MVDYYTFIFILHMVYILKINSKKIDLIKIIYTKISMAILGSTILLSTFLKKLKLKM